MLKVKKFNNVLNDSEKYVNIKGKILKICVSCDNLSPNINLLIQTSEKETLFNSNLHDKYMIVYPVNVITRNEVIRKRIMEEDYYYTENTPLMHDYFYSYGSVGFRFTGIEQGQVVREVKIFYEGVENDGSKDWNN